MKKFSLFLMFVAVSLFSFAQTDVLNRDFTGVSGTSYSEWTGTGASGAEYAGQSAGGNESIQLRSNNNNSGVVVTKSAGNVSQIVVKFNSNTSEARVLSIYGKSEAYSAPSDLYGESAGTLIADVAFADGAEQTIDVAAVGEFAFIGFRSKSGALYLDEVDVNWGEAVPVDPVAVESISLSKSELELVEGQKSEKLTVTYAPENANEGKAITWTSSDEVIATVADGVVTAVAAGTATITATTANGKTATCAVTVTEKAAPSGDLATSLAVGDVVIMINQDASKEYNGISGTIGAAEDYSGDPAGLHPLTIVAGSADGSIAFKDGDVFLAWSSGNSLTTAAEVDASSSWTVTFEGEDATIANVGTPERILSYNSSSPRFACYGNTNQKRVQFVKTTSTPVTPVAVESITLSESALELVEGQKSAKLTVTYAPENANEGKAITWTSSDEAIATVADGVVTAVAAGTATITATTANGKTATCAVTVTEKTTPTPSGDGDVLNREFTGVEGSSYTDWTGTGASGAEYAGQSAGGNASIQLRSTNNNSGVVVTKSAGNVSQIVVKFNSNTAEARVLSIYGKSEAYSAPSDLYGESAGTLIADVAFADGAEQTIDVAAVGEFAFIGFRSKSGALYLDEVDVNWGEAVPVTPVAVESISLSQSELELVEGQKSEKLTVTYAPENANEGKAITWTSSDEAIATVADGVVTAVAAGTATITATTENGKTATCAVTVTEKTTPTPSGDGDVLNREFTGVEGSSYTDWTGTGASGAEYAGQSAGGNESIQLRSTNNNSGVVVTKSAGNVSQIVVKFNSNTAEARVLSIYGKSEAYSAPTDLYGESAGTLIADVAFADGAEQTIDVAAVGEFAFIGFRSKSGALYLDEVDVNWGEAVPVTPVAVESITLSESALELVEGQKSAKLTVTYAPENANEGKAITWTSSDEAIATVADGVVTAVAAGTATITATTENGKTATCAVTVTEKQQSTSDLLESLSVGDKVIMINEEAAKEFGGIAAFGSNKAGEAVDFSGAPAGVAPLEIVAGSKDGSIAFKNGESYLVWTSGNTLNEESEISDNSSWVVTFEGTDATVTNVADETRILSYNATNPRFATYGNANQKRVQFVLVSSNPTGVENLEVKPLDLNAPMYNVVGQRVDASYQGIVIQNGQKYLIVR